MKKILSILGFIMLAILVVLSAALMYVKVGLPNVGAAEDLKIDYTQERIQHGQYLANCVTVCMDCHSTRDWSKFSGPLTAGTLGKGGERFDQKMGLPGVYFSKNITPAGINRYVDGELFRLITTGVNKDGDAIFPLMPYLNYGKMDREDIYDIIAYIRSIPPIEKKVPDSKNDFPMNFIVNTIPQKASFTKRPDPSDQIAFGAYLVNAAACVECHTQVEKGQIIPELKFGGGREFKFPDGSAVYSANITQDRQTGIGSWTRESFIGRFKLYADSSYVPYSIKPGEYNSIMPWTMYGKMKEEDLNAIFSYLQTIEPIENNVIKFKLASSSDASE